MVLKIAKKQKTSEEFGKSLKQGLKYPWNKASKLWNMLWILLPIFGWFALAGYVKKIVRELINGQRKNLPAFGGFWSNFKQGIIIFIFLIPTMFVLSIISAIPIIGGTLNLLVSIFLVPWLIMNFFVKETFNALWEVKKAFNIVTENIVDYLWAYLKTLIYTAIYGILSIFLIGIPCYLFGRSYFLTEFYKNYKE